MSRMAENTKTLTLTELAAEVVGAPRGVAFNIGSAFHLFEAVRARVVRAECLAALGLLARVTVALRVLGVVDRSEAVRAADGVAVQGSVDHVGAARRLTRCADMMHDD